MSFIFTALNFLISNPEVIFEIAFAVVSTASLITALTPTPRDDIFVGKVYKILEALALNICRAKETPPNRVQIPPA